MSVKVRKKIPKRPVAKAKMKKRKNGFHPLHPVVLSQIVREAHQPTALMEFIKSVEGEIEYREAIIEFQNEWCDHPASEQEVSSTKYEPSKDVYSHTLKCTECGKLRTRSGRAPGASRG